MRQPDVMNHEIGAERVKTIALKPDGKTKSPFCRRALGVCGGVRSSLTIHGFAPCSGCCTAAEAEVVIRVLENVRPAQSAFRRAREKRELKIAPAYVGDRALLSAPARRMGKRRPFWYDDPAGFEMTTPRPHARKLENGTSSPLEVRLTTRGLPTGCARNAGRERGSAGSGSVGPVWQPPRTLR